MHSITATNEFVTGLRGIGKSLLKLFSIAAWVIDLLKGVLLTHWQLSVMPRPLRIQLSEKPRKSSLSANSRLAAF